MTTNVYSARGSNAPGGDAKIETLAATVAFDGSLERGEAPPAIVGARYVLEVHSDEPAPRCALLHKNVRKFGTITNTLAAACELEGSLRVVRSDGSAEEFSS